MGYHAAGKGTDMFEKEALHCPRCGYEIRSELTDGEAFVCAVCRSRFRVILDDKAGKAAFYEEAPGQMPEPLYLPRGSIRALVAIAASASAWALIVMDRDVPGSLLSLILAVLAYYFGFRVTVKAAGSRMYDPAAVQTQPLNLPGGFIRTLLIVGFLVAGAVLVVRERIGSEKYLEFFVILAGMVAGYVFGRVFSVARVGRAMVLVNHAKGAVVLAAAGWLTYLLFAGGCSNLHLTALCAVVSFYYGSRS